MIRRVLPLALLLASACGDDGGSTTPDAGPDVDADVTPDAAAACAELAAPAGTIDTYPGTFSGTVTGAGADLNVAEGVCDVEGDPDTPSWYDQIGEDAVVHLTNLTVGTEYGVILTAEDDLGFYVITGCDEATGGPGTGMCPVFDDSSLAGEENLFTATTTEAWVVVDNGEFGGPPPSGAFEMRVLEAQCSDDSECTDPATPSCVGFVCVECATSFDCASADEPVCDSATSTCVAGPMQCTGDDAGDATTGGDDGPAGARALATPTIGVETSQTGAICSVTADELDWYAVTLAPGRYGFELLPAAAGDLDLFLLDASGVRIASGLTAGDVPEAFTAEIATAGTYYVVVDLYSPDNQAAAIGYTVVARVAECETSFDCVVAGDPFCTAGGACGAGPAECGGDDAGDAGGGDDGPAGARLLTPVVGTPDSETGAICNTPGEIDYYAVTVANGAPLSVELAWTGTEDLDVFVYDGEGVVYGATFWQMPERIDLTFLPAGTYYLGVTLFSQSQVTTGVAYTITTTTAAPAVCTGVADCAAEHSTQVFRGNCSAGACSFLPAGTRADGTLCDSGDDCMSGLCSYILFEADAQDSVCTVACTDQTGCGSIAGTTCLVEAEKCVPSCTTNLECGANINSSTVDTGEPWDYLTCTVATGVCSL